MDAKEYRAALKSLKLSRRKAALFLGVGERSCERWSVDGPPEPIGILLGLMAKLRLSPDWVSWHVGRPPLPKRKIPADAWKRPIEEK